jgi:hypothetical protein
MTTSTNLTLSKRSLDRLADRTGAAGPHMSQFKPQNRAAKSTIWG